MLGLTGVSPITVTSTNNIGCSTCFTGTTSIYTTTSSTSSTVPTTIVYTGANGIIVTSTNVIEVNYVLPISNSVGGLSLLYNSTLTTNAEGALAYNVLSNGGCPMLNYNAYTLQTLQEQQAQAMSCQD